MTFDEKIQAIKKAMDEVDPNLEHFIYIREGNNNATFGFGCPACAIEDILYIQSTDKDLSTHVMPKGGVH